MEDKWCDKFSVIIPMYNSEKTIEAALRSVIEQTKYESVGEIIIVNDGSEDNSKEIVYNFIKNKNEKIKIINQINLGVSAARNRGILEAKEKWIAFLDSDDTWLPEKLERQIKILEDNAEIDFLGCNHTDKELRILWKKIDKIYKASIKDICIKMFPQPSTIVLKKIIIEKNGGFDENFKYAEDIRFCMKIINKCNYYYAPFQGVVYGNGKSGFGESGLSQNMKEMNEGLKKNIKELYKKRDIKKGFYYFIISFNFIKYQRRKMIVCFKRLGERKK